MILLEFAASLYQQDDGLTAYISKETNWSLSSEVLLTTESIEGNAPPIAANRDMEYFLEVFLAKEVINEWETNVSRIALSAIDRANLLIYYAKNDSYPPLDFI